MRAGVIGLLAAVVFGSGCGTSADDCHNTKTCPPPTDAGVTVIYVPSDAGASCDGVCVPLAPGGLGWSTQAFVGWRGPANMLSSYSCPANAPVYGGPWYADPDQSLACPACSCAAPKGSCGLPDTMTANASSCMMATDGGVPFDPPSAWDGGCTSNDAIADPMCDGGPCSITVAAITPTEIPCAPSQGVISEIVTWQTAAFTCNGQTNSGACPSAGDVCAPIAPAGFAMCVSRPGDEPDIGCPIGYPARSVLYLGADDERSCTPCECGNPQGSTCEVLVSFYADSLCTESAEVGAVKATSAGPMCVDIPAGSPIGSKSAGPTSYTAGSCQPSGGEETGSVEPKEPFTFCCQK
jgi:hypothetical protein